MALIHRRRGVIDPDERLPDIPDRVGPLSSLPQTPPEQTARIAHAQANARILNRLHGEVQVLLQSRGLHDPLLELVQTAPGQPAITDQQYSDLLKAHGTMGDHMEISNKLTLS
jgi:hypothetical protein